MSRTNITQLFGADGWRDRSNCRDADLSLFFPGRGESLKEAQSICGGCEVREECLEYAVTNHEAHGVWGGTGKQARRAIRRVRAQELDRGRQAV